MKARTGSITRLIIDKFVIWGGGTLDSSQKYNDGAIYDVDADKWTKMPDCLVEGRYKPLNLIVGDNILIWGGSDDSSGDSKYRNDGAVYNLKDNKWTKMPDCPIKGRYNPSIVTLKDEVIIWGGNPSSRITSEKNYHNDGAIYYIKDNKWRIMEKCPIVGRTENAAIVSEDNLYIWGGTGGTWEYYNNGAIYSISKNTWKTMEKSPLSGRYIGNMDDSISNYR